MNSFIESIVDRLLEIFDPETLGTKIGDVVAGLIVGLVVLLVFLLIERIVRRVSKPVIENSGLDETGQSFVNTIVRYTVIIIGLLATLSAVGINIDSLLASIGIAGVTIGFAARDAFSNLISGLLIFLDRPFVIGDLVEVGEFDGHVEQITLRSTRIVTSDGRMLAVPNNEMINTTVASYTNFPTLRLDIGATVGVNENIERVRRIMLDILRDNPDYLDEPAPRVVVTQLNDYNVAVELQVWIRDERKHVEKKFELREKVFNALNAEQVEMPFETIQLAPMSVSLEGR